MPTVSISTAPGESTKREGQSGTTTFTFIVALDGASASTRFVTWSVNAGGAVAASASDFAGGVLPMGVAVFAPGDTSVSVTIEVVGDAAVEADEALTVALSAPSVGVTLGTSSATATIGNDDLAAHADAYVLLEGATLSVPAGSGVLANDEVEAGATAALRAFAQHGGLVLGSDGRVDYVPLAGFTGIDSFRYRATDANGTTGDVEVTIHVVPVVGGAATTLELVGLTAREQIAAIYVAFFGRAADAEGLEFWVGEFEAGQARQLPATLFANIASSFGVSAEARALYPFLADPVGASDAAIGAFLGQVYDNLFDRGPDAAGLAYWGGQVRARLAAGEFVGSVLVDMIGGARNTAAGQDITTVMSKVAVSLHYVAEQQRLGTTWTEADDLAQARALLDGVGAGHQSLLDGMAEAEAVVRADLLDGANRPAVVTGTSSGAVTEKGGVLNGTVGVATASGDLDATDPDGPATFVAQTAVATAHGVFTIGADGSWSFTLDDGNAAVQGLADGDALPERIRVATADGTAHTVVIAIHGRNDAAALSAAVANLVETNAVLSAGGVLTIGDVDSPATFMAQAATAGVHGTFAIDAAGAWSWTASSAHDAFASGTSYSDVFSVASVDGTTTSVTVHILGTNDAAVLSPSGASLVESDVALSTGGVLSISDVDSPATFVAQAATKGTYGTFAIAAAGTWSWTASSSHDAFVGGTTYSDSFVVSSADGTTTTVTVDILGTNDPAVLSPAVKTLVETNAVLSTGGVLTTSDVDSPAVFVAQAATVGAHGTFTIDAAGAWSWTASSAHDAFVGGTTYSDSFMVSSADGTTTMVTVDILGTNDPAVLSPAVANLVETNAILTTGGTLSIGDVDSPATFVAQVATAGKHGTLSLDTSGAWKWTASSAHDAFVAGTTYSDSFVVASADGTTTTVTVAILGTNDPAVLSPAVADLVETNAILTTGGTLSIGDVDSPATFVAQAATAGKHGTFSLDAAGTWKWTASSAYDAFVGGTTYSDSFVVASADGTTTTVTVDILGTNDPAVLSPAVKNLVETNAVLSVVGGLSIGDVDSPAVFVAQAATKGTYGTFSLDAAGAWKWTASSAHDAFVGGTTYSDAFTVASADGTTTTVTVAILGTNDPAALSAAVVELVETDAVLSTGGVLSIGDVDSAAAFVAQAATAGKHGTFAIDAVGAWKYSASSAHDEFAAGTTYSDVFTVVSADGTTTTVTVAILGANDAAVLSPAAVDLVETNMALSTGGVLPIGDVDSPATFVAQGATAGTYGTFSLDAAGTWSWTASSAHDAFVAGTAYSDSFVVSSADGTTTTVTVAMLGTNDPAELSTGIVQLVETDAILTTGGVLLIGDVDSAAAFVTQAATTGTYGTFSLDAAGAWKWTASSAQDGFVAGTT